MLPRKQLPSSPLWQITSPVATAITMLGRLLNTAASTLNPAAYGSRNTTHLESVTEEEHTSGLLFPDASLLRRSSTHAYPLQTAFNSPNASAAGAYDDRGGLELDPVKDFRVVIAQNALGDRDACVLLDTRASPESATQGHSQGQGQGLGIDPQVFGNTGAKHTRTMSSISRGSRRARVSAPHNSLTDSSPFSAAVDAKRAAPTSPGAFTRARGRSSTLSFGGGSHDSYHSRQSDSSDSGLLNCIFGSSAFSYRGSSTKMHIVGGDDELEKPASGFSGGRAVESGSLPHSNAARSPLSRAYTTGSSSDLLSSSRGSDCRPPAKITVLVTRMFSVNLPEAGESSSDHRDSATSAHRESLPESGFPFPDVTRRRKVDGKRTPMYAVAISIQIPRPSRFAGRPVSRFSGPGQDSPRFTMSSSLDSDHRSRALLEDSLSLASPPAGLDERIDLLVDHWDVITRTLSHLERLARKEILFLLKKTDSVNSAHPKPFPTATMQRTNQTVVHLPANVLAVNHKLKEEALRSTRRISLALQMPYVVTGQSRWEVWREEGRAIVRSLGDRDHSFFFLVLITAFLGNHTEWLNVLGPDWYRRRHYLQQKTQQDTDPLVTSRTVIISPDKMTARRLIFLLGAFLPAKHRFDPLPSPLRPGTSTSVRAVSQSPPNVPVLRQESLRRAIERRSRAQRMTLGDYEAQERYAGASASGAASGAALKRDDSDLPSTGDTGPRRGSDARSVKTLSIPLNPKDVRATKASAATTSTATPSATVPVPHFAPVQKRAVREVADSPLTESNDSLASENLLRNLKRSETSATGTNNSLPSASGRWGSLFSGLWSSRQDSSTDRSDVTRSTDEIRRRSVSAAAHPIKRGTTTTLSQMVKEAAETCAENSSEPSATANITIPKTVTAQRNVPEDLPASSSLEDRIRNSPLKLSVRAEDGVVDVDLPLPGFVSLSSSGDSTVASPKKTRTSVTSVDALGSTHSSASGLHWSQRDNDGPAINVAGWLKTFHEDFLLQAVRPYNGLEADIRRAMQAEATPHIPSASELDGAERWVGVASTLIADTRTFTVKRLRLLRKIPAGGAAGWQTPTSPAGPIYPGTPRHAPEHRPAVSPFAAFFSAATGSSRSSTRAFDPSEAEDVEERFIEEPVMDLDGTLVDAVERVLAQSGQSSLTHSRAPSPSRNKTKAGAEAASREDAPALEVPRGECRKTVLGALEEVVRSVTAEHCREDGEGELGATNREHKRWFAGPDNTLREGVRKWLLDVEEAWSA